MAILSRCSSGRRRVLRRGRYRLLVLPRGRWARDLDNGAGFHKLPRFPAQNSHSRFPLLSTGYTGLLDLGSPWSGCVTGYGQRITHQTRCL
ncbi:uncharacterized protein BT62DRAFT_93202 [Guyanagaster necrorhizus]|uniref:Uncharacterized protein n=1 Tax=Guyanagaster necrorhizus TaxID=856835 RepID=A0A9P7VTZ1_9AGAR|nr:uncharacterized protein BT62DRAFT_93202 [Guyanagaster necrorhizus MCA 3950]KAG7446904.1 hypothetical protein BT62DRAFT_93202 [Guyanagaster necrorhizus MCA 3950]